MATTDQWDYNIVGNLFQSHDLHEIILCLMGVDHEKLTYDFSGRDIRLTHICGMQIP